MEFKIKGFWKVPIDYEYAIAITDIYLPVNGEMTKIIGRYKIKKIKEVKELPKKDFIF